MKVKDRAARRRKDTLPALCLPGRGQRRGGGGGQRRGCGSPGRAASQATAIHPRLGGESAGQRAHRSASKGGAISSAAEYGKPVRRCTYLRTAVGIGSRQQRRRHGSLGGTAELERPVASIASSKRARAGHAALRVSTRSRQGIPWFPFLSSKRNSIPDGQRNNYSLPAKGIPRKEEEFLHFLPLRDEGKERNEKECTT